MYSSRHWLSEPPQEIGVTLLTKHDVCVIFSLSDKEQPKFFAYLQLLIERGNTLPSQYAKHLDGDLWELRPEFGGTEFRYFYFTMVGQLIVFVHAVKKKSQKTKPRDLALARRRIAELKRDT